jgi:O-antigen/teichoic acid export membrane protein
VTLAVRSAAGFFLRWRKQPYPAAAEFTRADFKELLHAGAPLLVCNYLWGTLCVADQSLIAIYLGETQLGFYTLSRLLMVAMMVIPSTMGMLLYPRASARYGKTGCRRDLRPFFWKALVVNMLIYAPLCGVAYLLLGPVVEWVLPKYIPGIHAAQINILTCLTFISCGPGVIAGAVKRNTPVMIAYGIGLAAIWSVGLYFCEFRTVSIEIIAMIRFGVSAAVALFVLIYSYRLTEKEGQG